MIIVMGVVMMIIMDIVMISVTGVVRSCRNVGDKCDTASKVQPVHICLFRRGGDHSIVGQTIEIIQLEVLSEIAWI